MMGCETSRTVVTSDPLPVITTREEFRQSGRLSEFEQDVVNSTWPLLSSKMMEHGCAVFVNVLHTYPQTKQFFPFGNISQDNLRLNPIFQKHGLLYMQMIADVVNNVSDLQATGVCDRLMVLGAKHASMSPFQPDYFKVVTRATLNTWEGILGEEYTDEVRQVWSTLLDYMTNAMTEGYVIFEEEGRNSAKDTSKDSKLHSVEDKLT